LLLFNRCAIRIGAREDDSFLAVVMKLGVFCVLSDGYFVIWKNHGYILQVIRSFSVARLIVN
jgi:hypothetical protein